MGPDVVPVACFRPHFKVIRVQTHPDDFVVIIHHTRYLPDGDDGRQRDWPLMLLKRRKGFLSARIITQGR